MDIWNRKIILYGGKKIQEDFKYLYQNLDINDDVPVEEMDYIIDNSKDCLIVVCEKKADLGFEKVAQEKGLRYKREYCYITDLFAYYNPIFLERRERKLAVWGTGTAAEELWDTLDRAGIASEIDFFIDNSRDKTLFKEKEVLAPENIQDRENVYIIVATYVYQWEIYKQLEKYGFQAQKDYIHCTEAGRNYCEMLEKVCFAEKQYSYYCNRPLGYCDVITGDLYLCCPDYLPVSVGSMQSESFMSCWDSYTARILRLSVLNGTFVFCNKAYCDLFDFEREDEKELKPCLNYEGSYSEYPNTLMVGIDYSCNLRCPSCRNKVSVAGADERGEMLRQAEDLLEHVIPYVGRLWLAGSGEVFFSKVYRKIWNDERCQKRESISILTNGTLFDRENWELLEESYQTIEVVVSMDGIKNETIEKLRRGADAKALKKNLEFLGKLRKENRIRKLFLSCVLQADNVAELYELLEYCRGIGVDKVQFLKLKDNGVYEEEEQFKAVSVFDHNDCLKKEFSHYFTNELLMHPLADWFNSSRALQVEKKPRLDKYDTL